MKTRKYKDTEIKPCGHQGFETMPDGSCAVEACGKHTPGPFMMTPWKIDTGIKSEDYAIRNTSGLTVAVCGYKEHAAFIVRAVNSHEELLEALKDAVKDIRTLMGRLEDEGKDTGDFEINIANFLAITKAEGE